MASCIPGARFVELPGNDHLPFVGDQDAILNEIESFLSNLTHSTDPERTLATVMVADPGPRPPSTPLGQFRTELDAEVKWFGGREARSNGRHAIATFEGPARAVRCACAIVARAASVGHAASAGIHTGECKIADRLVGGPAPEVARALQSRAATGEVLVSGTVRDLVAGSGLQFEPRGMLAVDGIEGEWQALSVQRCWTAAGRTE